MSSFTEPLTVTDLGNGLWRTERAFRYYVKELDSNDFIDVPSGFTTDFFSIPDGFQWILPKTQHGNQAAVLHDFLVVENKRSWKDCADIFLEAMKVLNVSYFKRYTMYWAVRAYELVRKKDEKNNSNT